jgi:hypothetical protein
MARKPKEPKRNRPRYYVTLDPSLVQTLMLIGKELRPPETKLSAMLDAAMGAYIGQNSQLLMRAIGPAFGKTSSPPFDEVKHLLSGKPLHRPKRQRRGHGG